MFVVSSDTFDPQYFNVRSTAVLPRHRGQRARIRALAVGGIVILIILIVTAGIFRLLSVGLMRLLTSKSSSSWQNVGFWLPSHTNREGPRTAVHIPPGLGILPYRVLPPAVANPLGMLKTCGSSSES